MNISKSAHAAVRDILKRGYIPPDRRNLLIFTVISAIVVVVLAVGLLVGYILARDFSSVACEQEMRGPLVYRKS